MRGSWRHEGRPCEDAEKRKKVRAHAQGCGRWVCGLRNEKEVLVCAAVMAVTWRQVGGASQARLTPRERARPRGLLARRDRKPTRAPGRTSTMIISDETPRTAASALLASSAGRCFMHYMRRRENGWQMPVRISVTVTMTHDTVMWIMTP